MLLWDWVRKAAYADSPVPDGMDASASLMHSSATVRVAAIEHLGSNILAQPLHAATIAALINDSDARVQCGMLVVLAKLSPTALAPYGDPIAQLLRGELWDERHPDYLSPDSYAKEGVALRALACLRILVAAGMFQHMDTIAQCLRCERRPSVQKAALNVLPLLDSSALNAHADAIVALLQAHTHTKRAYVGMVHAAESALQLLPPATLSQHVPALFGCLNLGGPFGFDEGDEGIRTVRART